MAQSDLVIAAGRRSGKSTATTFASMVRLSKYVYKDGIRVKEDWYLPRKPRKEKRRQTFSEFLEVKYGRV